MRILVWILGAAFFLFGLIGILFRLTPVSMIGLMVMGVVILVLGFFSPE